MMIVIAAALAASAPAAQPAAPADAHAHHGQHQPGQQHDRQGQENRKGMTCCDHGKSGAKMGCCKDMADATKACCKKQGKGETGHQH